MAAKAKKPAAKVKSKSAPKSAAKSKAKPAAKSQAKLAAKSPQAAKAKSAPNAVYAERRATLFAAVYANPADTGAREVLGDFLQTAGDPHGELIALQLAKAAGRSERNDRLQKLLKKPAAFVPQVMWKALDPHSLSFEGGFPVGCRLQPRTKKDLQAAIGAVEWATVQSLDVGYTKWNDELTRLLAHAAMKNLRRVGLSNAEQAVAFARAGVQFPWSEIYLSSSEFHHSNEVRRLEIFADAAVAAFPEVTHLMLSVFDSVLKNIPSATWFRQLEKITVVGATDRKKVERALTPLGVPLHFVEHKSIPFPYWYEVE